MLGEGQLREQAKKQWERIDTEGHKIINDLLVADKERTVWPENTEPKFTRKKGTKLIKVAFDTKIKKYTHAHEEKEEVPVEVDELNSGSTDDFITNNDQVQTKRPVQHQEKQRLSPEMKKKLDNIIDKYSDIFSKDQYDIGTSTHPPVEIPTEGPPCISAPYTIPLKFRPWADNTINKLLEAGMIQ